MASQLVELPAERGGDLLLASPTCLEAELDAFIDDLAQEIPVLRKGLSKREPGATELGG